MSQALSGRDRRRYPRLELQAAYTQVQVRRQGRSRYSLSGHAYDLSDGGVLFELDKPLNAGEKVQVRIVTNGAEGKTIHAAGRIVRLANTGQPGPSLMALAFAKPIRR